MSKVFISYGSNDAEVAGELCSYLESHGIPCWIASRDISSGIYAGEITRAIKAADLLLVLHSAHSAASPHVKNEINIACNSSKAILPYCLDSTPYDDDLEYYLSSHQRISSSGHRDEDFAQIERIIREKRGEKVKETKTEPSQSVRKHSWIVPLLLSLIVALTAGLLFFHPFPKDVSATSAEADLDIEIPVVAAQQIVEPEVAKPVERTQPLPSAAVVKDSDANTFTGSIKDGYPDGTGTFTFVKARRIDMHDEEARVAEAGDYIYGNWTDGHLNYGTWYAADGTEKGFIKIGDCPNVELDHQFGKCVHLP